MVIRQTIQALLLFALVMAMVPMSTTASGHPKPEVVPTRPELTFEPGPLRVFHDEDNDKWYWYMTYVISNYTGEDRIWAPTFILYTDRGEVLESGRGISRKAVNTIDAHLNEELLEAQYEIIGDLYQGEGNARQGLVVWPAARMDVNEMVVFVSGISGETAIVNDPLTGQEKVLQKTLMREYLIPGNASAIGDEPIELHSDLDRSPRWIFR